jgi:hypothetical protein
MGIRGSILALSLLLALPALAESPDPEAPFTGRPDRFLVRLDGVLHAKGGAKGGGGTLVEDPDQPGTSAGIESAFGFAVAAEVRVVKAVWLEAGGSWCEPEAEFVRSTGLGQPLEVNTGTVSIDTYSLGIDVRPARWNVARQLQFSVFLRQVWSRYGPPPEAAQVEMDDRASGLNAGVRADWRWRPGDGRFLLGMDLAFGSPAPSVRDPLTGSEHDLQNADFLVALGVRWSL